MVTNTLEKKMIAHSKEVIANATKSISKEIQNIRKTCEQNSIIQFENIINGDWNYYEHRFFNEERFEKRVRDSSGYFNYNDLCEEIDEYIKVYTWYAAWMAYMDGDL